MRYLRAVQWWSLAALLLATAGIVVAVIWPDRLVLVCALGLAAITLSVLALREEREET